MTDEWDLPDGWEWACFRDVAQVVSDLVDPAAHQHAAHIAPNHIESGTGRLLPFTTIKEDGVTSPKHRFQAGQVLYSKIRPYLAKAVLIDFEGLCSADMYPVSAQIDVSYLHKWLISSTFTEWVSRQQGRTVLPKVNQEALAEIGVPVPPLAEQRRIVAKIEALQARSQKAREALEEVPTMLEQFRQSVLATAFRGDLTATWRDQHPNLEPASTLLDRVRDERRNKWEEAEAAKIKADGRVLTHNRWKANYTPAQPSTDDGSDALPESWIEISFDEVSASALYGPRFGVEEYVPTGVPTVRITDMDHIGNISNTVLTDAPRVSIPEHQRDHFCLQHGDLLITRTGATIGKCALFDRSLGDAVASAYLIRYRLTTNSILPKFLLYFLLSPSGNIQLTGGARAVAVPNINTTTIARISLPLVPLEEQHVIVSRLDQAFARLDCLTEMVSHAASELASLDQSILAKAFRGELVPQDPNDEPASVMLDRIRAEREQATESPTKSNGRAPRRQKRKAT